MMGVILSSELPYCHSQTKLHNVKRDMSNKVDIQGVSRTLDCTNSKCKFKSNCAFFRNPVSVAIPKSHNPRA